MKLGIVISSSDAETAWNALRLGNFALKQGDEVRVFFIAKGVEYEQESNAPFDSIEQAKQLQASGGIIYACGTCIKARQQSESKVCPISTMADLHAIIKTSDKLAFF